jgi:hypothetical protein
MNYELLCTISGTIEALHWLPLTRPLGHSGMNSVAAWQTAYTRKGLGFAKDRQTAEALRTLTAAGLLAGSGSTQSKSHRLTTNGTLAAMVAKGLDPKEPHEMLKRIIKMEQRSAVMMPQTDTPIVMAWDICAKAGKWLTTARASKQAWKRYQNEQGKLSTSLLPLLVLGYAELYTDCYGNLWGTTSTEAGRMAANAWPEPPKIEADKEACLQAWAEGFNAGLDYEHREAPPAYSSILMPLIPASAWM